MSGATDAEAPAPSDPRSGVTGGASVLSETLTQLHVQGVGLSIHRVVWLTWPEARTEPWGDLLLVHAPDAEAARHSLISYLIHHSPGVRIGEAPFAAPASNGMHPVPSASVDLREIKQEAERVLPRGHPVRDGLAQERDVLPMAEGRAKLETYLRLLLLHRVRR